MAETGSTEQGGARSKRGLWLFDGLLGVIRFVLVPVTALFVILAAIVVTGHGSVAPPARIQPPYSIGIRGGHEIQVATDQPGDWTDSQRNSTAGDESRDLDKRPTVHATVKVDRTVPVRVGLPGTGRWALVVVGVGLLALAEVFGEGAALREFERDTI